MTLFALSFLSSGITISMLCAVAGLVFAFFLILAVSKASPGNARMQEIAAAIQEGAKAYLNRQVVTIGVIAAVIFVLLLFFMKDGAGATAVGFLIGAVCSLAAGYIGMRIAVLANVRTTQAASRSRTKALRVAFNGGAVTGLLVVGLALLSVGVFYTIVGKMSGHEHARSTPSSASRSAPVSSASSPVSAAASTPRRPTSARTSSAKSNTTSKKTIRATRRPSPTTWATTSATAPAWRRTCSKPTRSASSARCWSAPSRSPDDVAEARSSIPSSSAASPSSARCSASLFVNVRSNRHRGAHGGRVASALVSAILFWPVTDVMFPNGLIIAGRRRSSTSASTARAHRPRPDRRRGR